jgi:tetratricopeptide (TPR) repeat protein
VTILNEYASAVALQANQLREAGDEAAAQQKFQQAHALLERSKSIDARYGDTDGRIADLFRLEGRYAEAVDRYAAILQNNPRALDGQITSIIESMHTAPDQLLRLRDAYQASLKDNPDDVMTYALIGLISARADDLPSAAQAFSEVARLEPQNLEARQNYTLVLSDMMQYEQAAAEANTLLTMAQQQNVGENDLNALQRLVTFLRDKAAGK